MRKHFPEGQKAVGGNGEAGAGTNGKPRKVGRNNFPPGYVPDKPGPGRKKNQLTILQKRFVQYYDGNGAAACRKAGYQGSDKDMAKQAHNLMQNPKIRNLIRKREERRFKCDLDILDRKQRQKLWTEIALNEDESTSQRLKALELLGRSEGDFMEKIIQLQATKEMEIQAEFLVSPVPTLAQAEKTLQELKRLSDDVIEVELLDEDEQQPRQIAQ